MELSNISHLKEQVRQIEFKLALLEFWTKYPEIQSFSMGWDYEGFVTEVNFINPPSKAEEIEKLKETFEVVHIENMYIHEWSDLFDFGSIPGMPRLNKTYNRDELAGVSTKEIKEELLHLIHSFLEQC